MIKQLNLFDMQAKNIEIVRVRPLGKSSILNSLTNVNVEYWWAEKLFMRSNVKIGMETISISAGKKKYWAQKIISKYFEGSARKMDNGSASSVKLWAPERAAQNVFLVNEWFNHCADKTARAVTKKFITQARPVSALYYAHREGMRWEQFKIYINECLKDIIIGEKDLK